MQISKKSFEPTILEFKTQKMNKRKNPDEPEPDKDGKEQEQTPEKKAKTHLDIIEEHLICPILQQLPRVPVAVPCMHVFDFEALANWFARTPRNQLKLCPVCREWIKTDDIESLPIDLSRDSLLRVLYPEEYMEAKMKSVRNPLRPSNKTSFGVRPKVQTEVMAANAPPSVQTVKEMAAIGKQEFAQQQKQVQSWADEFITIRLLPLMMNHMKTGAAAQYELSIDIGESFFVTLGKAKRAALVDRWKCKFSAGHAYWDLISQNRLWIKW